jgi:chromosome segregation ATPase
MQHGSPHFGASECFACIPGIRRQRDEATERAERLDVQLQDTQSDYEALEAERDSLRAEVARLTEALKQRDWELAESGALVMSHEAHIAKLEAEVARLTAEKALVSAN